MYNVDTYMMEQSVCVFMNRVDDIDREDLRRENFRYNWATEFSNKFWEELGIKKL